MAYVYMSGREARLQKVQSGEARARGESTRYLQLQARPILIETPLSRAQRAGAGGETQSHIEAKRPQVHKCIYNKGAESVVGESGRRRRAFPAACRDGANDVVP